MVDPAFKDYNNEAKRIDLDGILEVPKRTVTV